MISSAFQRSAPSAGGAARPVQITGEVGLVTVPPRAPDDPLGVAPSAWRTARQSAVTDDDEPTPLWRRVASAAFTLAILALVVFLWPARLGGNTRLVIVTGDSMEPTYEFGDIVVTRDQGEPDVGDIVVFAVPDGQAKGILVIHRVTEESASGVYRTQGDNRDRPDSWDLTSDDVVGVPLLRIPKGGFVAWYLQQWWVVAIVVGLLAFFLMWPDGDEELEEAEAGEAEARDIEPVVDRPLRPWPALSPTAGLRALVPRTEPTHDALSVRVAEPEIPSLLGPLFDPLIDPAAGPLPASERITDRVPLIDVAELLRSRPAADAGSTAAAPPLFDPLVRPVIRPLVEPSPTEPEAAVLGVTDVVADETTPLSPFLDWSDRNIDAAMIIEAAAWLERQLAPPMRRVTLTT